MHSNQLRTAVATVIVAVAIASNACGTTVDIEGNSGGAHATTTSATPSTTATGSGPVMSTAIAIRYGDIPPSPFSTAVVAATGGGGGPGPDSLSIVLASWAVGCTTATYWHLEDCNAWRLEILIPPELVHTGVIDISSVETSIYSAGMSNTDNPDDCTVIEGGELSGGTLEIVAIDPGSVQLTIAGTTVPPFVLDHPEVNAAYTAVRCPTAN